LTGELRATVFMSTLALVEETVRIVFGKNEQRYRDGVVPLSPMTPILVLDLGSRHPRAEPVALLETSFA